MNKRMILIVGLLIVSSMAVATSEFRSPIGRFGDVWFDFRYIGDPVNDDCWQIDVQKALYQRNGSMAFGLSDNCLKSCNDTDSLTTKTVPLSALFFNKANFKGQEIFFGGNLNGRATNWPSLVYADLSPRVSVQEHGVSIGVHAYRQLKTEKEWRIGGRIGLPIKVIKVEDDRSCCVGSATDNASTANCIIDCRQEYMETNGTSASTICSYRLDYLASLLLPNGQPMVVFGDGTSANPTKIAGRVIDETFFSVYSSSSSSNVTGYDINCTPAQETNTTQNIKPNTPVYLMRQSSGAMPFDPIFNPVSAAGATGNFILKHACANSLPANGNVGADNDRYRFVNANNYAAALATDPVEQAKWFVIPVAAADAYKIPELTHEIFNIISYVVQKQGNGDISADNALGFFAQKGIDLTQSQHVVGAGDLELSFYGGRYWEKSYCNGFIGCRLPTGKEHDNPQQVYLQTPGHNGHFELLFGVDGGVQTNNICAFVFDAAYHYVVKHTERRATPFAGSTIRNIGAAIDADVSWGWVQANAGLTIFHPQDADLGCTLGYEFYAKQKDSVCLCAKTATDLLGGTYALDKTLLEKNTNTQTHKVRGTGFYKIGYAECIFGASYIFAGKHAMKETSWHIGINVNF